MLKIFQKKEINTCRQYNFDLLKAIAIVAMVLCHAVMQFSSHIEGYRSNSSYIFGVVILGTYVAVAHAFMFCMGIGFVYSKRNTPKDLLRRGCFLYGLAYILNFLRYSVYIIGEGLITGSFRDELWSSIYVQDILHFAGIAMILTAFFKKLKLNSLQVFLISAVMSVLGSVIAFNSTGIIAWDVLLGNFFTTTTTESHFALLNWYIFVALGMLFGDFIRRVQNLDRFYKLTTIVSAMIMVLYISLTKIYGFYFLSKNNFYYAISIVEALGLLSIDLFIASVCYFIQKFAHESNLEVFINMSKNVNSIYIIHWCIIGFIDSIFCYLLGIIFPYWMSYFLGCVITIISYMLSMIWKNRKNHGIYTSS